MVGLRHQSNHKTFDLQPILPPKICWSIGDSELVALANWYCLESNSKFQCLFVMFSFLCYHSASIFLCSFPLQRLSQAIMHCPKLTWKLLVRGVFSTENSLSLLSLHCTPPIFFLKLFIKTPVPSYIQTLNVSYLVNEIIPSSSHSYLKHVDSKDMDN